MKYFLYAIVSFLFSCGASGPKYIQLSDNISQPFCRWLEKTSPLKQYSGGGSFMDNVGGINISFMTSERKNVKEAKIQFTALMEDLLARYNNNEEIRPFLAVYPFEPENIRITISYDDIKEPGFEDYVSCIQMMNNKVCISTQPVNGKRTMSCEKYSETYREVYGHDRPETK